MKSILAHLDPDQSIQSVLKSALICARRFDSYLEGMHMRNAEPELIAAGADGFIAAAPELMAGLEQEASNRAARAQEIFEAFMAENDLRRLVDRGVGKGLSADWRIVRSQGNSAIGHWGRLYDLVVVGSAVQGQPPHHAGILETALFETGRPILVAPPTPPEVIGEQIVIHRNGSTETARAVALAMPFLSRARGVTVLTVEPATVPGPDGEAMAAQLRHHNIQAGNLVVNADDVRPGAKLLSECERLGADLLVKGAFTQSRLRQMIFGGVTSHIIDCAQLPVLMAA